MTELNVNFKTCSKCGLSLPATADFWHRQKAGKYGIRAVCKKCSCEEQKKYRSTPENKEKHRIGMIEWRKKNHDRVLEINRKSYKTNGTKYNQIRKERYSNDAEYRQKRIEYDKKYKESGKRYLSLSKPENREAAKLRSRARRKNEIKREHDYAVMAKWREENKEHLLELWQNKRTELKPSYVAQILGFSVKDLTPEVLETKQIIIKLKRELRTNNIKIK